MDPLRASFYRIGKRTEIIGGAFSRHSTGNTGCAICRTVIPSPFVNPCSVIDIRRVPSSLVYHDHPRECPFCRIFPCKHHIFDPGRGCLKRQDGLHGQCPGYFTSIHISRLPAYNIPCPCRSACLRRQAVGSHLAGTIMVSCRYSITASTVQGCCLRSLICHAPGPFCLDIRIIIGLSGKHLGIRRISG